MAATAAPAAPAEKTAEGLHCACGWDAWTEYEKKDLKGRKGEGMRRRPIATHCLAAGILWLAAASGCRTTSVTPAADVDPAPAQTGAVLGSETGPKSVAVAEDLEPIYFEFDSWHLTEEARRALRGNAERIRKSPKLGVVTIEGHCDERGSTEYNLALGEQRAAAVRRYLETLGVSSTRFETVSFGEYRPAVKGHDESAWRYNRRSELKSENLQVSGR